MKRDSINLPYKTRLNMRKSFILKGIIKSSLSIITKIKLEGESQVIKSKIKIFQIT